MFSKNNKKIKEMLPHKNFPRGDKLFSKTLPDKTAFVAKKEEKIIYKLFCRDFGKRGFPFVEESSSCK